MVDNYITKKVRVVYLARDYAFTKNYQNISNHKEITNEQEFSLDIRSEEITRKRTEQELSFLHATLLLDLIYVPTVYY